MSMTLSLKYEPLPAGYPEAIALDPRFAYSLIAAIDEADCDRRYIGDYGDIAYIPKARASAVRAAVIALDRMTNPLDAALAYAEANDLGVEICSDDTHFFKVLRERFEEVDLSLANGNAVDLFEALNLPFSTKYGTTYSVGQVEHALEENLAAVNGINPRYVGHIREVCAYARARRADAAILQAA